MITIENYEEFLVMHADGELQPHEEAALQAFLSEHPHLREELRAYEMVRLAPDTTLLYTEKESLKKAVPARRIAFLPGWRALGIAAGIAAVLVVSVVALNNNSEGGKRELAGKTEKNVEVTVPLNNGGNPDSESVKNGMAVTNGDSADKMENKAVPEAVAMHSSSPERHVGKVKKAVYPGVLKEEVKSRPASSATDLVNIAAGGLNKLPVDVNATVAVANIDPGNLNIAPAPVMERRDWIERLPINDSKKDQLNGYADAVALGMDKASNIKDDLGDKKLSVKVEKRRLILSF